MIDLGPDEYVGSAPDMGAFEYSAASLFDPTPSIPKQFALYQNYPNPFNPVITLRYDLPVRAELVLTIYDILGREIRTLVRGVEEPGFKSVVWDGKNDAGESVGTGVYLYRISSDKFTKVNKMILLR